MPSTYCIGGGLVVQFEMGCQNIPSSNLLVKLLMSDMSSFSQVDLEVNLLTLDTCEVNVFVCH